ncbi:hypothetical protein [Mycobacterium asiaticum]|uniref:hypothetical protein n=1 Tax=Mycobacterium asiaticum TaxID=1790 RepID=UPI000560DD62|nr:hypothetical protein [Mycobacterium asiaticum]ORA16389.1 hypothetical protein BST16_06715 [Mycobacterium asiaticum DSM 44297]
MHDDFDRPDRDLTENELRVRIEALSRALEHITDDDGDDSDVLDNTGTTATAASREEPDDDDDSDEGVNTAAEQRRAAINRIVDNLGLRPTNMKTTLSDKALSGVIDDWAQTEANHLTPAGHRGAAASATSAKIFRIASVPVAIFGVQPGEMSELWAKVALEHPEPEITRVVAEIVLSPTQTPRSDVVIVSAVAVSGSSTPIRMPLALRNYALPGGEPMYALVGSASVLYRDLQTMDAVTSIHLEVAPSTPEETL